MTTGALADALIQEFGLPGQPARFQMSSAFVEAIEAKTDTVVVEIVDLTRDPGGLMVLTLQQVREDEG